MIVSHISCSSLFRSRSNNNLRVTLRMLSICLRRRDSNPFNRVSIFSRRFNSLTSRRFNNICGSFVGSHNNDNSTGMRLPLWDLTSNINVESVRLLRVSMNALWYFSGISVMKFLPTIDFRLYPSDCSIALLVCSILPVLSNNMKLCGETSNSIGIVLLAPPFICLSPRLSLIY